MKTSDLSVIVYTCTVDFFLTDSHFSSLSQVSVTSNQKIVARF